MRTQIQKIAILILMVSSFLGANLNAQEIVKSMGKFVPVVQNGMAINPNPIDGTSIAQISDKADGVDGVFKIPLGPYQEQNVFAGTFSGTIDGNNAKFYCVDLTHGIKYNEDYEDNGNTSAEITYIMNHYFPHAQGPNELSDLNKEASAVQIALWHFSDGATVDQNSVSNSTVRNRALDIIADANANASSTVTPSTLSISPSSQNVPSNANASFNVRVEDANGNGVPNVTVNLSSTSGTLSSNSVTTDANGDATFTLSQGFSNSAVVTATANLEIPQGTKYVHKASPNQYQQLVLATPITVSAQAAASVFWGDGQDLCITLSDGSKFTIGRLYTTTLQNGDVKVRLEISKDYNDNTYQEKNTTPIYAIGWPNDKHDFKALHKSDKAEFEIFDKNGNSIVRFELDYLEQGMSGYPSGYGPRIENIVSGNINYIKDINSSLSRNFNDYGYVLTQHSPATDNNYTPNSNYPNWEFGMIYEFTVDQSAGFGSVDVVSLHNSPNKLGTDKQTFPDPCVTTTPGSLGDKVWEDTNEDGIQDIGEDGLANVTVELYDCNGNYITSTTTDGNGNYLFSNLTPGDYTVKFIAPSGYVITTQYAGNDDAVDSDANENDGKTGCITIASGDNNLSVDAGMFKPKFKIGDFVWHDKNYNGIQDAGESGIENVKVNLIQNNGVIATTTTDANGYYEFNNLFAGSYEVEIDASNFASNGVLKNAADEKWYASPKNQGGDDAVDSDGDETTHKAPVTLTNADDLTVDFGFFKTSFTFDKSGPQSVNAGDVITYTFTVVNTGDLVLHGGVSIFDALLNPSGNHQIWNGVVNPGETKTITKTYTTTADDCGDLVNNATAVGHPVIGSTAYPNIEAADSWTTTVVCQKGSIGDKVWNDINHDGIQDNGEVGIDGVTVKLLDSNGNTVQTTTTANGGLYKFNNIDHGTYYVEFSLPANYVFSPKGSGNDNAVDSDVNTSTGKTDAITLAPGQDITTVDAGMYDNRKAFLGDFVWNDTDHDGIQDQGEGGIANVTVKLFKSDDTPAGTTTTGNNGAYSFSNLVPGTYYVQFVLPTNYVFSPKDAGNDTIDSDANTTDGKTGTYTLNPGDNVTTVDAGMYDNRKAKIGDYVWNDTNMNGVQDNGESGKANVTVKLIDSNNNTVATTTTNNNGYYLFNNVVPGTYTVEFVLPTNYAFSPKDQGDDTKDSDANSNGKTDAFSVAPGDNNTTIDAGMYDNRKASLGDFVWNDTDHDGIQDQGEGGIANVTVKLFKSDDTPAGTTTTGNNGAYIFSNLVPGTYYVQFVLPANYVFSPKDQGGNDAKDSDANTTDGKTGTYTLNPGDNVTTVDAGMYDNRKAKIGDYVWNDTNMNGVQDNGETGIAGVTVKLYKSDNTLVTSTTTNNNGVYSFSNVEPGSYYVQFELPANYAFSPKDQGSNDSKDSDADPTTGKTIVTILVPGENDLSWDAGMFDNRKASLGDYVWVDDNSNGKQDQGESGIGGVTVKLYDDNDQLKGTKVTANDGSYLFDQLDAGTYYVKFILPNGYLFTVPNVNNNADDAIDSDADVSTGKTGNYTLSAGDNETSVDAGLIDNRPASIGDFVWNDANGNGIQESVENGVPNITVYLLDSNGDTVQTTTTNGNGYYQFTNVAPGTYTVEFVLPSNYAFSPKDQGNDTKDSDANPNGITDPFTVNHGDNNTTIDAGIKEIPLQPATIGDMVWNDLDHDGVQDQGETGYAGVTVKLFTCAGALKNVTTTDANGHYSFTIPANELGDYYVEFDLPQGYMFSPKDNASGNNADEIDSDADANGKTDCITINSGSTNDTWDAGIYEIPATSDLSLTKSVSNTTPNDGDQITYTVTVTNHGPADATGVEVTDVLPDGLVFVSATASAGNYVDSTGIWTVGSIAANSNATLEITAKVDVQSCITGTIDLGPATGFNLFVWRDFKAPSSDVEGKVAVGRDAELSNYSIADKLNGSYSSDDVFIVNRDLYFTSGRVYYGNATYGRATNLPKQNVTIDGSLRKDRPIDFAAAKAYLKNLSTTLSNYAVNGNTTYQWSGVFLEGNDPYLNVFEVSGTELTNSTYMDIKVPNGSVVLVNVDGKHITWNGGLTVTGTSITNVLYNFHKARTLNISGIDVRGSILAPFANVTFNSGLISGQLIAKSMFGNGQINNYPFVGNVPCPSEIVNVAEISAADQGDPDSTPGNGDANEDDYASVTINIGTTSGGGSGGGNGGGSGSGDNGNWDVASQFPFQEIVWTMANDASGNMLAGTIGGHLFISYDDGANWTQINENLVVGFIWDIAVHPTNGAIAIGTEQGVFYTTNDGATWNGPVLSGDVRALVFDANGNAYAGVWGLGVFKSTNNGQTWTATSNGLSPYGFAVQSLAIDVNGDLYAGTFGGGVYKSDDEGATWTMLNVGYPYVWSVAVDSHLNVYAATYGAGVYKSSDAGANWYAYNNGLDAAFVYSVIVDANDNVYAATWLGGIYQLTNAPTPSAGGENVASNSWTSLGLGGVGISSLLVNPANGTLYAGSNDGAVYMQAGSTTGVNDELEIPKEFSLAQNYPNPFNPSTTIKFGVPKDGEYSLKVYNVLGQLVATLVNGQIQAGYHEVNFNANSLSSGIYIYRFQGKNVVITKKMILMK